MHSSWIDVPLRSALRDWQRQAGPLYARLAASLRRSIETGALPAGRKLPPERILASYLGLGRRTVARAYESLSEEGLIDRRQGAGTRVTGPLVRLDDDRAAKRTTSLQRNIVFAGLSSPAERVIDMLGDYAAGDGTLMAAAVRSAADVLEDLAGEHHGYVPAGFVPLRRAIAARYTALGIPTGEEQILVTSGAQHATSLIAADLVSSGEAAVVEDPTVPGAIDVFRLLGTNLLTVPVGDHGVDIDALEATLHRNPVGMAYLMPPHQSPTGAVVPADGRRRIAELARSTGVGIVEDTTLADISIAAEPPPPIARYAGDAPVLTIGSLSKLFWAGLRIGWVRGPREMVAHLGRLKAVSDLGSSMLPQVVALALFEQIDEMRERRRAELAAKLDRIEQLLASDFEGWTWRRPAGGLCLWLRMPHGSAVEFAQVARSHGVAVAPGTVTSAVNGFDDHLRLPFSYDPDVSTEGMRRLAAAWRAYDQSVSPASGRGSRGRRPPTAPRRRPR
jgi:DNA-binding transcriptional MocR family regulator